MSTQSAEDRTTVLVCITCRAPADPIDAPRKGPALADATLHALGHVLIFAHRAGLLQQLVHQSGFAMVDMGDDGDVANIHESGRSAGKAGLIDAPCAPRNRGRKSRGDTS